MGWFRQDVPEYIQRQLAEEQKESERKEARKRKANKEPAGIDPVCYYVMPPGTLVHARDYPDDEIWTVVSHGPYQSVTVKRNKHGEQTTVAIFQELTVLCKHCLQPEAKHAKNGKCLYEPTNWEK